MEQKPKNIEMPAGSTPYVADLKKMVSDYENSGKQKMQNVLSPNINTKSSHLPM